MGRQYASNCSSRTLLITANLATQWVRSGLHIQGHAVVCPSPPAHPPHPTHLWPCPFQTGSRAPCPPSPLRIAHLAEAEAASAAAAAVAGSWPCAGRRPSAHPGPPPQTHPGARCGLAPARSSSSSSGSGMCLAGQSIFTSTAQAQHGT